jgi:PKD repeat protein
MAELNADFASANMIFCADPANFYEDAVNYTHDSNTEEVSLKTTYNVTPTQVINIYVVGSMSAGGYARFPYDPMGGTSATGGIVLNRGNCNVGTHTLAHEMGHTFGLEHTFAGVDERSQCSSCYEQVRNVNGSSNTTGVATPLGGPYADEGDREGDWCSDTNPHDTYSYNCSTSSNPNGGCDSNPWANAPVNNHMSYSFCSSQFTAQQIRRMHCMTDAYLGAWIAYGGGICGAQPPVADFVGTPTVWQAPSNVNFTDLSQPQAIITQWTWTFDVAASGTVTCAGCVGANATFVGQTPPVVTYPNVGLYTVSLTVDSPNGSDTETKVDYIEVVAPAGDCDTLDLYWETPVPSPTTYGGLAAGEHLLLVPDVSNSSTTGIKGGYERYITPNVGVTQVGAIRVGLAELDDINDNMVFQVVVYDDDGFGAPGAILGGSGGISPTALGVPATGSGFFQEYWIPFNAVTPTTATFHVGIEVFPGDLTDELVLIASSSALAEGVGNGLNHIWSEDFGYENLLAVYGLDLDLDLIPMLGEYAPLPLVTGFTENVVCDTTYVTIFDTALYSSVAAWSITFADGTVINSLTDPMAIDRIYTSPGPDTVTFAVVNDCGRGDTTTWIIPYGFLETPSAEFTASPANPICMGTPVTFTADVPGYPDYSWDYGDGTIITSSGNTEFTTHTYTAPGWYYVELTTTQAGYLPADTFYLEQFEAGWPAGYQRFDNDPFTPALAVNPPFTGTNATAWLDMDADGDGDGEATSTSWNSVVGQADDWMLTTGIGVLPANQRLFWDAEALDVNFPDGYEVRISTTQLPANVGNYATLLYSTAAENAVLTTHSVDLSGYAGQTVYIAFVNNSTDMFLLTIDNIRVGTATPGCSATLLKTDFVEVVDCTVIPPTAVLNASPASGCNPLTVTFTDATTVGDPATSWLWNFGDGTFSTLQNPPPHAYTSGSYYVIFEACNAGGCTQDTITIFVGDPATITNVATTDPSCTGNDGSIVITATGGTGTLQYSIDNGVTFQASNTFNGLGAATYNIVVEDAIGCQVTTTATLVASAGPSITNVAVTDPSCNGGTDGSIVITASGGTGTLQYSIDNGVTFQASNTFNGLGAATYNIVVEDANLCQANTTATLTDPPAVVITNVATVDPTCNGGADGTITITASGGTGALNYSIDNGVTFQASNSFTGLGAATYNIVVEDANGCQVTTTATLIDPPAVVITNVATTDPSCAGNTDGTITITASGGAGTLQYSIDNGVTFQAGNSFAGLGAATYNIVVEDANGCQATTTATLIDPPAVAITNVATTDPSCAGNDGTIVITAAGGTGTLQYSIDNGVTFQASNTFAGLGSATYTVVVEDANGCQATTTATLNSSAGPNITNVSVTDPSCNGGTDGTATVTATGGTAPYTYLWDAAAGSQTTATAINLGAGTYSVSVTDANGCVATATATVNDPTPVTATIFSTDVSCNGGNDGTATATPSGGTSPYTYLWDAAAGSQTTATAIGLGLGTYSVTVTDANGCTATTTATINEPTPIVATTSSTDETCATNDGTATAIASGGTAPYAFLWDAAAGSQTTATAINLVSGTYSVTITDANGCTTTGSVFVNDGCCGLTATASATDATCNGDTDGTATVIPAGGTAPFTILWDAAAGSQTTATAIGLGAGTYSVTTTDANGCIAIATATVNEPTLLTASTNAFDVTCNGGTDGQATASASGGTAPYTFLWDAAAGSQTTATAVGLGAGTYSVTITDANGCTATTTATINEPTTVVASTNSTDALCNGGTDGTATATASGGTGSYTFLWDAAAGSQTTATAIGLGAGTYSVTITDANGCTATAIATVNEPSSIVITNVATTDPTCNGDTDGTINIAAAGGTGTLQYSIDNGVTFQASNSFAGLGAATYNIVVEDANGCQVTSTATLIDPPVVTITNVVATDPTCSGNDGTIVITATGGTGTIQYSIDNGVTFQASNTFAGLADATYTVVVADANNCQATSTATLTAALVPTITNVVTTDAACGNPTGQIDITATGGTGTLQYSIDNGVTFQASNIFASLTASTYTIVVQDANGCQATSTATIINTASPTITNVATTDPTCGNNNGDITITATGGTGTLMFSIDNGVTFQASNTFTGLGAATYNIVVEDALGCQGTTVVGLTDPGTPVISNVITTDPSCGNANGTIIITASGGTGTLQYSIDNGVTFQASNNFVGLSIATYTIVVQDANGCQTTASATLVDAGSPSITSVTSSDPSCGNTNGSIGISATGGTGPYLYSIDNGATFTLSANFTGLSAGTYTIIVEDANGCSVTSSVTLIDAGSPVITIDSVTDLLCFNDANGGVNITVTGGSQPYTFDWSNDGTGDFDDPEDLTNGTPGVVSIVVLDANGCAVIATATINGPADMWATASATPAAFGNDGAIDLMFGGGTPPYTIDWSNDGTGDNDDPEDISGLAGNTTYTVTITDANGCVFTLDVFVGSSVSISEMENPMGVNVYPNPNSGQFFVSFDHFEGDVRIDVVDVAGRLVYQTYEPVGLNGKVSIDVSDAAAGAYSINVITTEATFSTRMMKR